MENRNNGKSFGDVKVGINVSRWAYISDLLPKGGRK